MNVCGAQMHIVWEDKPANFLRLRRMLAANPPAPGSLLVLPEMFATGFSMDVDRLAEGPPLETCPLVAKLAKEWSIGIVAGWMGRGNSGRGSNEAGVFSESGHAVCQYSKLQLFSPGEESDYFEPGNEVVVFRWREARVSPFICYDLRFPEHFRTAASGGAEVFVVIANWPAARAEHWTTLLRARAIENQAFVVGVNRCGRDPHHAYAGGSCIIDPMGQVLAEAGSEECLIHAELNLSDLREWRRQFPALKDRRPVAIPYRVIE